MYKVISTSRLPISVTVTNSTGLEVVKTLPRYGQTTTEAITRSIQLLTEKGVVIVYNLEQKSGKEGEANPQKESLGFTESARIQRLNQPTMDVSVNEKLAAKKLSDNDTLVIPITPEMVASSEPKSLTTRDILEQKSLSELKELADQLNVRYGGNIGKDTLVDRLAETEGIESIFNS